MASFRVRSAAWELLYALPSNWLTVTTLFHRSSGPLLGLRGFASSRAMQEKEHRNGLGSFVTPSVARTVLQDHVAAVQIESLAVVQLQPHLSSRRQLHSRRCSFCAFPDLPFRSDPLILADERAPPLV